MLDPGPSKPTPRRVVNYDSSDDQDDVPSASPSPVKSKGKSAVRANGVVNGDSARTPNGTPKKRKRLEQAEGSGDAEKRKKEAEKLYETRRELPFYQGECWCGV